MDNHQSEASGHQGQSITTSLETMTLQTNLEVNLIVVTDNKTKKRCVAYLVPDLSKTTDIICLQCEVPIAVVECTPNSIVDKLYDHRKNNAKKGFHHLIQRSELQTHIQMVMARGGKEITPTTHASFVMGDEDIERIQSFLEVGKIDSANRKICSQCFVTRDINWRSKPTSGCCKVGPFLRISRVAYLEKAKTQIAILDSNLAEQKILLAEATERFSPTNMDGVTGTAVEEELTASGHVQSYQEPVSQGHYPESMSSRFAQQTKDMVLSLDNLTYGALPPNKKPTNGAEKLERTFTQGFGTLTFEMKAELAHQSDYFGRRNEPHGKLLELLAKDYVDYGFLSAAGANWYRKRIISTLPQIASDLPTEVHAKREGDIRVENGSEYSGSDRDAVVRTVRALALMVLEGKHEGYMTIQKSVDLIHQAECNHDETIKRNKYCEARTCLNQFLLSFATAKHELRVNKILLGFLYTLRDDKDDEGRWVTEEESAVDEYAEVGPNIEEDGATTVASSGNKVIMIRPISTFEAFSRALLKVCKLAFFATITNMRDDWIKPTVEEVKGSATLPILSAGIAKIKQIRQEDVSTVSRNQWFEGPAKDGDVFKFEMQDIRVTGKDFFKGCRECDDTLFTLLLECLDIVDMDTKDEFLNFYPKLKMVSDEKGKNPRFGSHCQDAKFMKDCAEAAVTRDSSRFALKVKDIFETLIVAIFMAGSAIVRYADLKDIRRSHFTLGENGTVQTNDATLHLETIDGKQHLIVYFNVIKTDKHDMIIIPPHVSLVLMIYYEILCPVVVEYRLIKKLVENLPERSNVLKSAHVKSTILNALHQSLANVPKWADLSKTRHVILDHMGHEDLASVRKVFGASLLRRYSDSDLETVIRKLGGERLLKAPLTGPKIRQLMVQTKGKILELAEHVAGSDVKQMSVVRTMKEYLKQIENSNTTVTGHHTARTKQQSYGALSSAASMAKAPLILLHHRTTVLGLGVILGEIFELPSLVNNLTDRLPSSSMRDSDEESTAQPDPDTALLEQLRSVLRDRNAHFLSETQLEAMKAINERKNDVFLCLPCGEGKTLAMAVPLSMSGNGMIVPILTPFRALREGHFDALSRSGFRVQLYDAKDSKFQRGCFGGLGSRQRDENVEGTTFILFTVESAVSPQALAFLEEARDTGHLKTVVIDEAHHVMISSEFRVAFKDIADFVLEKVRFVFLSGTLPSAVQSYLTSVFQLSPASLKLIKPPLALSGRPKRIFSLVRYPGTRKGHWERRFALGLSRAFEANMSSRQDGDFRSILVLVHTTELAEKLKSECEQAMSCEIGSKLRFMTIHSKLPRDVHHQRVKCLFQMQNTKVHVVFATSQLADGVDIPELSLVIIVFGLYNGILSIVQAASRVGRGRVPEGKSVPHAVLVFSEDFAASPPFGVKEDEDKIWEALETQEMRDAARQTSMFASLRIFAQRCDKTSCHTVALVTALEKDADRVADTMEQCGECTKCNPKKFLYADMSDEWGISTRENDAASGCTEITAVKGLGHSQARSSNLAEKPSRSYIPSSSSSSLMETTAKVIGNRHAGGSGDAREPHRSYVVSSSSAAGMEKIPVREEFTAQRSSKGPGFSERTDVSSGSQIPRSAPEVKRLQLEGQRGSDQQRVQKTLRQGWNPHSQGPYAARANEKSAMSGREMRLLRALEDRVKVERAMEACNGLGICFFCEGQSHYCNACPSLKRFLPTDHRLCFYCYLSGHDGRTVTEIVKTKKNRSDDEIEKDQVVAKCAGIIVDGSSTNKDMMPCFFCFLSHEKKTGGNCCPYSKFTASMVRGLYLFIVHDHGRKSSYLDSRGMTGDVRTLTPVDFFRWLVSRGELVGDSRVNNMYGLIAFALEKWRALKAEAR